MARLRASLPRGLSRSPRRQTSWGPGPFGIVASTTSSVALFSNGSQATVDGLTLVRLRGELLVFLLSVAGGNEGYSGAFGVCIVSENAFNAGIASIPTPIADQSWDGWLAYQMFHVKSITGTIADGANGPNIMARYVIDSKAMRKFKQSDFLVAVTEMTEVGTSSISL